MKRSAITRRSPLHHGGKPLQSGTPMKRGAPLRAKGKSRFPKRRDDTDGRYAAWVRTQRCLLNGRQRNDWRPGLEWTHVCLTRVQACHVKSRGSGGADLGNLWPGCAEAHGSQHVLGTRAFQDRWKLDLKAEAARLYQTYLRETGAP